MPKISVVIPVYNGEKYVLRCIKMLSFQTVDDIEVIFVDDGSKDNSRELLEQKGTLLQHSTVLHKENGGVSSARNCGLSIASGQFVVFADIDDLWEPDYFEKLLDCYRLSSVDLSVCGYRYVDTNEKELFKFQPDTVVLDKNKVIKDSLKYKHINTALWNKMFRMDIINDNNIRFNEDLSIGEDMAFLLEYCTYIQKAKIISDCLYSYTQNPNGAMLNRKSALEFNQKWITEWHAILFTENILKEAATDCDRVLRRKKARIADKLLGLMERFNYQDYELKMQLLSCLRNTVFLCLTADDINFSRKISICFNAISPRFCYAVKYLKKYLK